MVFFASPGNQRINTKVFDSNAILKSKQELDNGILSSCKNEVLIHVTTWMNLEIIISERI
jgi:hypothetical protein